MKHHLNLRIVGELLRHSNRRSAKKLAICSVIKDALGDEVEGIIKNK